MTTLSLDHASHLLQHLAAQAGWRNSRQAIIEALPHMTARLAIDDVIQTLENLTLPYTRLQCRQMDITEGECPALVFPRGGDSFVVTGRKNGDLITRSVGDDQDILRPAAAQKCDVIRIDRHRFDRGAIQVRTVSDAFSEWRPMMPWLLFSSFLVNVLGLLSPLLIMAIYDRVIPSGSEQFLFSLALGVAIILATDFALRHARTKTLAYVGRQGERQLSHALFQKLMALPLNQLQKSDVDQQIARFRQFEGLREVFTGQTITTLLDLPFALIFIAVLFYLTPLVGMLAVAVCLLLALLALITIPTKTRLDRQAAEASAASRAIVHDAILHQETIVNLGLGEIWQNRSTPLAEAAESATLRAQQFQNLMLSLAQSLTALATLAAIFISAHGAMVGEISFGALIAVIALVSKIIAPIHGLYANAPQILSFLQSRKQADRVLALAQEMEIGLGQSHQKAIAGKIALTNVTHRPDPLQPPVLSQVTLTFEPGEIVAIFGSDMVGRRAVLDLIDGLYTPLAGSIEIDEIDIRQIARDELRRAISYATFETSLFYGTVTQNFRLAAPDITEQRLEEAVQAVGLKSDCESLADGYDTRLTEALLSKMPQEFAKSLTLARSIAKETAIYLFAEPTVGLSAPRRAAFKQWLQGQAGHRTLVIATADQSLLDLADRYVFLSNGRLVVNDRGEAGLKKLEATLQAQR